MMTFTSFLASALLWLSAASTATSRVKYERATGPFLTPLDNETWVLGNEIWNMTQERTYGVKLYYKDHDCVGDAVGHYVSYNGAASNLNWTAASIVSSGTYDSQDWIDIAFTADEGDMHWVIFSGLPGAYQYFVNRALPDLGEFRTLWRLDNTTFTHGRNNILDQELPPLSDYLPECKVQDETWLSPDGEGYITKYDFSAFVREQTAYGVYGPGFGSWYINAGKDYYNGNHLKQELTVHRESLTGDAVLLNMVHGTHFMASLVEELPEGKMWGPWLWYLNDGDADDAEARAAAEFASWPYAWLDDDDYQARGNVSGQLTLSDGRPAAHAAVFLGDDDPTKPAVSMGSTYYYTTYADENGTFAFTNVRAGRSYGLQAWSSGGALADVTTTFLQNDVRVAAGATTDFSGSSSLASWAVSDSDGNETRLFQVGDFDRASYGFRHGGAPYAHAAADDCPASLTYTVGSSNTTDWCFAQTKVGNWTIAFEVPSAAGEELEEREAREEATLIVSLAGYSTGTDARIYANGDTLVGNLTSGSELLANDPSLYRSATAAGEWRYLEFVFDAGVLQSGWNNITFAVTNSTKWRGIMWDSIILEW